MTRTPEMIMKHWRLQKCWELLLASVICDPFIMASLRWSVTPFPCSTQPSQGVSSLVLQSNSRFRCLKTNKNRQGCVQLRPPHRSRGKGALPEVSWSYSIDVLESHSLCVSLQLNGRKCSRESNLGNGACGHSKTIAGSSRWFSSICLAQPRGLPGLILGEPSPVSAGAWVPVEFFLTCSY